MFLVLNKPYLLERYIFPLLIILSCSSCATLFNSRTKKLEIITDGPATVVMNNDTLKNINNLRHRTEVLRQRAPLVLSVYNDTLSKNITVHSNSSFAFYANFGLFYGLGMLIDRKNPKRFTYPNTVYISMKDKVSTYATIDSAAIRNKYIVKFTPLKLAAFTNPGIELSCEKRTGKHWSSQIMASYLLPGGENIKGFRAAYEEKYYLKKSAPIGKYVGVEFNYMQNRYEDTWRFGKGSVFSDTNHTNYVDTFRIKKQTYSLNFKFGWQLFVKRVSFDFYMGLGIRYKNVRHFDRINPEDEMESPMHPNIYYITNLDGKYWTISLPLNFRIGWIF